MCGYVGFHCIVHQSHFTTYIYKYISSNGVGAFYIHVAGGVPESSDAAPFESSRGPYVLSTIILLGYT